MNTVFAILSIFAVQRKEFFILQNKFLKQKKPNIAHFYVFCAFLVFEKAMKRIVIFASGDGTNAENIIRYFRDNKMIEVVSVYSENASAGVHHRAKRLGIPSVTFPKESFADGTPILKKLTEDAADFIVLAGFLKKIPDVILHAYPEKILNIHPALLPKHGGKGMYGMRVHQAVVAAGDTESGITIHYINDRYDEGQAVFQARCSVAPTDTPEDVAAKVHALEYAHYPVIIERVLGGENLHESI